jgi:hypothetical protein
MRRLFLISGACLLSLSTFVGLTMAGTPPKKPPPPKKPAPTVHKAQKPPTKPKVAHAPKPHTPPKKATPKVATKAKPLVKVAARHPTGPAHKQEAKKAHIVAQNANKNPAGKPANTQANKDRKPVNGLLSHSVKTSRHEHYEFHSHHFASFNKERGEYSFHSHWWHSFVTNPGSAGWSSNWSTGDSAGDATAVGGGAVSPTAVTMPQPPIIKINQGLPMSKAGRALAAALDGMDVEHHWLAGQRVDWKTGNSSDDDGNGTTSNGGAFVAAIGARLKVPMPVPEGSNFLPGNQFEWLLIDGKSKGWLAMGEVEAQLLANQGWVVIAAWKNPASAGERKTSGMLAVVRPDSRPVGEIAANGPTVILANDQNRNSVVFNQAFPASAWVNRDQEVVFFAHRQQ